MKAVRCVEGMASKDRVPVTGTVYGVPARLKELSESYFVMFNRRSQRFEVHDAAQPDTTLACELPYEELDARAVEYVRERHVSRFDQLVMEVDRHNERLEKEAEKAHMDKANDRMRETMTWLKRHEEATEAPKEVCEA